jgi:hypothetical protein
VAAFVEGATSVESKIRSPSNFNDRRALMATPYRALHAAQTLPDAHQAGAVRVTSSVGAGRPGAHHGALAER